MNMTHHVMNRLHDFISPDSTLDDFEAWLTTIVVTMAFVLPLLSLVIYGLNVGWLALGLGGLGVMFFLWLTYYSILWPLMQQRRG